MLAHQRAELDPPVLEDAPARPSAAGSAPLCSGRRRCVFRRHQRQVDGLFDRLADGSSVTTSVWTTVALSAPRTEKAPPASGRRSSSARQAPPPPRCPAPLPAGAAPPRSPRCGSAGRRRGFAHPHRKRERPGSHARSSATERAGNGTSPSRSAAGSAAWMALTAASRYSASAAACAASPPSGKTFRAMASARSPPLRRAPAIGADPPGEGAVERLHALRHGQVADAHLAERAVHVVDEALRDQARQLRVVAGIVHQAVQHREQMQRHHLEAALQRVGHAVVEVERRAARPPQARPHRCARRCLALAAPGPDGKRSSASGLNLATGCCQTALLQSAGDRASNGPKEGRACGSYRRRLLRLGDSPHRRPRALRLHGRDAAPRLHPVGIGAAAGAGRRAARAGAAGARHPSTTADFGGEVFYYISQMTNRPVAFLNPHVVDQPVLAVYFDQNSQVGRIGELRPGGRQGHRPGDAHHADRRQGLLVPRAAARRGRQRGHTGTAALRRDARIRSRRKTPPTVSDQKAPRRLPRGFLIGQDTERCAQCAASTASSSSATMLVILIIGFTAGPAVSL